jgi:hypothetical protein
VEALARTFRADRARARGRIRAAWAAAFSPEVFGAQRPRVLAEMLA